MRIKYQIKIQNSIIAFSPTLNAFSSCYKISHHHQSVNCTVITCIFCIICLLSMWWLLWSSAAVTVVILFGINKFCNDEKFKSGEEANFCFFFIHFIIIRRFWIDALGGKRWWRWKENESFMAIQNSMWQLYAVVWVCVLCCKSEYFTTRQVWNGLPCISQCK